MFLFRKQYLDKLYMYLLFVARSSLIRFIARAVWSSIHVVAHNLQSQSRSTALIDLVNLC